MERKQTGPNWLTRRGYVQIVAVADTNHRIIGPRRGFSPQELASCTVTAPNVTLADAPATTLMVLGKGDALDLIEPLERCEDYMVDKHLKHFNSSGYCS